MNLKPFVCSVLALLALASPQVFATEPGEKIATADIPQAITEFRVRQTDLSDLPIPDAIGQELYVNADSLCDKSLAAEAYVLPWFGRRRTRVNESGYAVVKKLP